MRLSYHVKELFLTLQGEGAQSGRVAVFCRFSGCNLWSGREEDRSAAACPFCDTDFRGTNGLGGGIFADADLVSAAHALAERVRRTWEQGAGSGGKPFVVLTGGEPLLQVDAPLIDALKQQGFELGLETNGTLPVPAGIDWVCVSPKAGNPLVQRAGDEIKLVYPQPGLNPETLERLDFKHFVLQPMDGPEAAANTAAAIEFCLNHPRWRLGLQMHKRLGMR